MSKIIPYFFVAITLTIYPGFLVKENDGLYLRVPTGANGVSKGLYRLQPQTGVDVPTLGLYVVADAKPVACPGRYICLSVEKITPTVYDPRN